MDVLMVKTKTNGGNLCFSSTMTQNVGLGLKELQ